MKLTSLTDASVTVLVISGAVAVVVAIFAVHRVRRARRLRRRVAEVERERSERELVATSMLQSAGRRAQQLLARQVDLITRLEADTRDPELLEHLFALDHLAARMQRNADAMLVLAGDDSPHIWSSPTPVADVVRAALGEVEQFTRVEMPHLGDASVVGHAAAEVTHVVAELVENALHFSPPQSSVEIEGRCTEAGYALRVTDRGIGMPPEGLRRANARLAGADLPGPPDERGGTGEERHAPGLVLGHEVVARIAVRHRIGVALHDGAEGGIVATVLLPPALIEGWDGATAEPDAAGPPVDAEAAAPEPSPEPDADPQDTPAEPEPAVVSEPEPTVVVEPEPAVVAEPEPTVVARADPEIPAPAPSEPAPASARDPYAELADLSREREAEQIAGAVARLTDADGTDADATGAAAFFAEPHVDDLLPRLPRRRAHGLRHPSTRPGPSGTTAAAGPGSEGPAGGPEDTASTAASADPPPGRSDPSFFAEFRAATARGRKDAAPPGSAGPPDEDTR